MKALSSLYRTFIHFSTSIRTFLLAKRLHCVGRAVEIGASCIFSRPELIDIGHHVYINLECIFLTHQYSLRIGNFVMIGPRCTFLTSNHNFSDWTKPMYLESSFLGAPIVIEDDVWIGANATILPGVTIGRGSVIGAGSVVTHNVEPYSITAGNPARKIRQRFSQELCKKAASLDMQSFYVPYNRSEIEANGRKL